jgi:hypothetical protein
VYNRILFNNVLQLKKKVFKVKRQEMQQYQSTQDEKKEKREEKTTSKPGGRRSVFVTH